MENEKRQAKAIAEEQADEARRRGASPNEVENEWWVRFEDELRLRGLVIIRQVPETQQKLDDIAQKVDAIRRDMLEMSKPTEQETEKISRSSHLAVPDPQDLSPTSHHRAVGFTTRRRLRLSKGG